MVSGKRQRVGHGQSVIEYAGALVIAAAVVLTGLVIVPPNFAGLMSLTFSSVGNFLAGLIG